MIKLIIFDAGGVLYTGSKKIVDEATRKFLKKHGINNPKKSDKVWSKIEKLVSVGKITLRSPRKMAGRRWPIQGFSRRMGRG